MDGLALKLVLTPALIGAVSLVGRRWGPGVSGWLLGIPFTSGPIALFLALNHSATFAATAAAGTLAGAISQAAFCVAYGWLAFFRRGWPLALTASCLAFAAATVALRSLVLPVALLFLLVVVILVVALRLMPARDATAPSLQGPPPRGDIPARMVAATVFVLVLTGAASALGPHLTGLLAPVPLYAAILAIFAHRLQGPDAAARVLRGLLLGLFAFAGFFLILTTQIERVGVALAFTAAGAAALALQAGSLWVLRRGFVVASRRGAAG